MAKRGISDRTPRLHAWLAGLLATGGFLCTVEAQQPAAPRDPHRLLVDQYCISCHNDSLKTAELALDVVSAQRVKENAETWEKVVRKLRARQMPPVGSPRPDENTYESAVGFLEASLDSVAAAQPNPGRTDTLRRLTRTEYQNAIRDLLALEMNLSSLLPRDESSQGFDNITVTDLSPNVTGKLCISGGQDQSSRGWSAAPLAGCRDHQDEAGPHPGVAV